jgi:hypothetical protein
MNKDKKKKRGGTGIRASIFFYIAREELHELRFLNIGPSFHALSELILMK